MPLDHRATAYPPTTRAILDAARNQTEPQERWHSYLQSVRQMYEDHDATHACFDIAALALRDPALRPRLARLNSWTIDSFIDAIGVEPGPGTWALAELVFAAIDGIELHHALVGEDCPLAKVLDALETLMLRPTRTPPRRRTNRRRSCIFDVVPNSAATFSQRTQSHTGA